MKVGSVKFVLSKNQQALIKDIFTRQISSLTIEFAR